METANNAGTHPARRAQAADSEGRSLGLHRDRGPRRLPGPRGQVFHRPLVGDHPQRAGRPGRHRLPAAAPYLGGRIPTDRGYRYFVDFLMETEAATPGVRRTVRQEFESAPRSVDGILEKAAMVLAQVAENVSLVTAPEITEQRIKHIDLVSLEPQSVLIILVLEGNLLKQQVVHLDRATSQDDLSRMAAMLNHKVKGQTADELAARLAQLGPDRGEQRRIIERVIESIATHQAQRQTVVLHDGVRNLLRHPEFVAVSRLEELLDLREQGAQLASILQQVAFEKDVEIIIGRENTSSR